MLPKTIRRSRCCSLHVGNTPLLARLTRHSARRLELAPGQQVWVQIKAVALVG
jgi:molybdate transport system ATP-binding protein